MRRITGSAAALAVAIAGVTWGTAAAGGATPKTVTITQSTGFKFRPNRYIQDELRWKRDVYTVKSGGTVKVVNTEADEGPHTFTIVKKADLPKSFNCKICDKLATAHGVDPNSEDAPPKFPFLENGVGQAVPPVVDRPGDSGITGEGKKGESISMKVGAKKGSTLYFMCLIHPWMQAKLIVK